MENREEIHEENDVTDTKAIKRVSTGINEDKHAKGRFDNDEKNRLISAIRSTPEHFFAFLHCRKKWLDNISQLHNAFNKTKRSKRSIQQFLSRQRSYKSSKINLVELNKHVKKCNQANICNRCLHYQKVCVQAGIARCGDKKCSQCSQDKPDVSSVINYERNYVPAVTSVYQPGKSTSDADFITFLITLV